MLRSFEGHKSPITSVAFSPDGRYVLTGSADSTARLWDAATGLQLRIFTGHKYSVESVTFSPDGRYVLTGSSDQTARIWDVATGQPIRSFRGHTSEVRSIAVSPNGRYIITTGAAEDSLAMLWDAAIGQQIRIFGCPIGSNTTFSPDSRFVLADCAGRAQLWSIESGQPVRTFELGTYLTHHAVRMGEPGPLAFLRTAAF